MVARSQKTCWEFPPRGRTSLVQNNLPASFNLITNGLAPAQEQKRIALADLGREPFRIFFPAALLASILGVALWPVFFAEWIAIYPGQTHARIMAYGFFGGFILGFLGTAMPRMLSAPPLGLANVILLFSLYAAMVLTYTLGQVAWGDALFALLLLLFASLMIARARHRQDLPPPGFVLVGLAFLCAIAAALLGLWQHLDPENAGATLLQKLLGYQGFILLPILGIGPFILPRFFGMPSPQDLPESLRVTRIWLRHAAVAAAAGLLVILSLFIELTGRYSLAYGLRSAVTITYILWAFPWRSAPHAGGILANSLRVALFVLATGFVAVTFLPAYRTGLLHLTLMGGFAIITLTVATRVIFGHSGNIARLRDRNRWMLWAVSLILLGMATRISGDLWPHIMISHYNYGALLWAVGVGIWAWKVLPKVLCADDQPS
jgi:uncharacterized protein involved in response to NO